MLERFLILVYWKFCYRRALDDEATNLTINNGLYKRVFAGSPSFINC